MTAGDYCTLQQVKDALVGPWGLNQPTGSGSDRDSVLAGWITTCSRLFDRATGKTTGYWSAATGAVRRYSGNGQQTLDIDDWQAITAVSMSTKQDRSDDQALDVTYDPAVPGNYVVVLPTIGPPFNQLFLLRSWLPDVYDIGNVTVTGTLITPAEIATAVAVWAVYSYRASQQGWQTTQQTPDGPVTAYQAKCPPLVQQVIDYYRADRTGARLAVISPDQHGIGDRHSPWLGWQTPAGT
jgi:hypothetical protein